MLKDKVMIAEENELVDNFKELCVQLAPADFEDVKTLVTNLIYTMGLSKTE